MPEANNTSMNAANKGIINMLWTFAASSGLARAEPASPASIR